MTVAKEITNSGKYAVLAPPLQGFLVLTQANTLTALTAATDRFFQKLWIYPGVTAAGGKVAANAGTVYVGKKGNAITLATVTLAVSGLTVTVTATSHGLTLAAIVPVTLSGATPTEFNGTWPMTVVDANTLSFTLPHVPDRAAVSGTITAEWLAALNVTPDWLVATDTTSGLPGFPLKYELPLGQKMRLADVVVQGAQNDGVFYSLWG